MRGSGSLMKIDGVLTSEMTDKKCLEILKRNKELQIWIKEKL